MNIFDLKTYNAKRCIPYIVSVYRINKKSGKYNRVITQREHEKSRKDCDVSKRTNCINDLLYHVLVFKWKQKE